MVSILTRPEGRVQLAPKYHLAVVPDSFNPHPSRRTGATELRQFAGFFGVSCFNPHPSRRTGATRTGHSIPLPETVSILTRPEGRVQHDCSTSVAYFSSVSILTRPEGRVQRRTTALNSTLWSNFSALSPC